MTTWIHTYTGKQFDPLNPDPSKIRIEDIAHALSMKCRWTGHTRRFYSIAEHSCRVARELQRQGHSAVVQLAGLLHDAGEAYLPDVASPVKGRTAFRTSTVHVSFTLVESILLRAICDGLGLQGLDTEMLNVPVRTVDLVLLSTEARDLMHGTSEWGWTPPEPLRDGIVPLDPEGAERAFLSWYSGLRMQMACYPERAALRMQLHLDPIRGEEP